MTLLHVRVKHTSFWTLCMADGESHRKTRKYTSLLWIVVKGYTRRGCLLSSTEGKKKIQAELELYSFGLKVDPSLRTLA